MGERRLGAGRPPTSPGYPPAYPPPAGDPVDPTASTPGGRGRDRGRPGDPAFPRTDQMDAVGRPGDRPYPRTGQTGQTGAVGQPRSGAGGRPGQPFPRTGQTGQAGGPAYAPRRPQYAPPQVPAAPRAPQYPPPAPRYPQGPGEAPLEPLEPLYPPPQQPQPPSDPGYDYGYDDRYPDVDADYDEYAEEPPPPPQPQRERGPRQKAERAHHEDDRGPELPKVPGLDGLRALALAAVLVSAQGFDLGRGGFLGISTAFTLSGFLLATLALAEWSQAGTLALPRFWERRGRKLVPPVLVTVLVVCVLQLVVRVGSVPTFRGDVLAALSFSTNWRLAFPAEGFAESFSDLSALRHLWPVAITAQVFLLFPLLFVVLMWITGRQWRIAGALFGVLALLSFGSAWTLSSDPDAREFVYYATHTRMGELLVGVVLGYAVLSPAFRKLISRPKAVLVVRYGALLALVGLGLMWTFVSFESSQLFHGITLLNAVLTAWVILAMTLPGPAATLLGVWPLRQLGEISFGAYLAHWPLFLLLDEDRVPLEGAALFGVRVAATLVAAVGLYWAVEQTFRRQVNLPRMQLAGGMAGAAAVLAAVAFVLPVNPPQGIRMTIDDGEFPGDLEVVSPSGDPAARVLVVGDEFAGSLVPGFEAWNSSNSDDEFAVDTHVASNCPLGGPGDRVSLETRVEATKECESWRLRLPDMLDAADYDAIVVLMGSSDVGSRKIGSEWRHLGDPEYDRWMSDQIRGTADVLAQADVPVLWATTPHVRLDDEASATKWPDFADNDPGRIDRLNELIVATVGDRRGFSIVELEAWLYDVPRGEFNPDLRGPDTFTEEGATEAIKWLAPQITDAT